MTVTVRMSGQVNGWTSKIFVRTKGIGDCDSVHDVTSKWVDK